MNEQKSLDIRKINYHFKIYKIMITIFPENLDSMFLSGLWAPSWDLILSKSEFEGANYR